MSEHDELAWRGRPLEEDYFRKKDLELIEKIRQSAAAERARTALGQKTGINDPQLVHELHELGFTPDTVALLPAMPIIEVAWAEGGVTKVEHELIVSLARSRGIEAGGAADQQLIQWLASRPSETVFSGARRLIRAILDLETPETRDVKSGNLAEYCEQIAAASGGVFGFGSVSAAERKTLASIAADLKARHA